MSRANFTLRERTGLGGGDGSLPFLRVEREMTLPQVLNLASALSGNLGMSIDVLEDDNYLVSYCGGSPYWWLPGTHGGGMHQISSRGWCHDCLNEEGDYVHHLPLAVETGLLTSEALYDPVLRKRLKERGQTAEQYAQMTAGRAVALEDR